MGKTECMSSNGRGFSDDYRTDKSRGAFDSYSSDDLFAIPGGKSQTSSSPLFMRIVKCYGKILCAMVLVPICALVESVVFMCVATVVKYVSVVKSIYQKNRIVGVVASVTVAPLMGLVNGINMGILGLIFGAIDGVKVAYSVSPQALISTVCQFAGCAKR